MEVIKTKDFLFRDETIISYIGNNANVVIPPEIDGMKVTKIGDLAFFATETIKRIVIPDSVTEIGYAAFQHCNSLVSIKMPKNTVVEIDESAFDDCENLTCLTPFVAETMDEWLFFNCDKLKKVPMQRIKKERS